MSTDIHMDALTQKYVSSIWGLCEPIKTLFDSISRPCEVGWRNGSMGMHITVYSQELCPPCIALKQWLDGENIPYRNVYTKTLTQAERQWLREKILSVSKLDHPTVPAVRIINGEYEIWVSNHGETDVAEMTKVIKKILG